MMLPGPVRRQVGVVGGGGVGHGLGAPRVQVAEVVAQLLRLVRPHVVVIPEHVVVARTAGTLLVMEVLKWTTPTISCIPGSPCDSGGRSPPPLDG